MVISIQHYFTCDLPVTCDLQVILPQYHIEENTAIGLSPWFTIDSVWRPKDILIFSLLSGILQ